MLGMSVTRMLYASGMPVYLEYCSDQSRHLVLEGV